MSDNVSTSNTRIGINASTGSAVQRNTARANGTFGISMLPRAGYRENVDRRELGRYRAGRSERRSQCL